MRMVVETQSQPTSTTDSSIHEHPAKPNVEKGVSSHLSDSNVVEQHESIDRHGPHETTEEVEEETDEDLVSNKFLHS